MTRQKPGDGHALNPRCIVDGCDEHAPAKASYTTVHEPTRHQCPIPVPRPRGTIVRCDKCGRYWEATGGRRWYKLDAITVFLLRLIGRIK